VSSNLALQREVASGGMKCEGTRSFEGWSPEVIPSIRWKRHMEEDLPFQRKSLREKRGHVEQEILKVEESEFI
jgi:hypothetical protein